MNNDIQADFIKYVVFPIAICMLFNLVDTRSSQIKTVSSPTQQQSTLPKPLTDEDKLLSWMKKFQEKYNVNKYVKTQKRKIKVAIIDTGFASKLKVKNIQNVDNGVAHSHGTHVGGIISGINPNIELISFKVDEHGKVGLFSQAILKAVEMKVDLINISMSGPGFSPREILAIKKAELNGIIIVVASGNANKSLNQTDCDYFPACYSMIVENMIVVGNIQNDGLTMEKSSNYGEFVNIYTFGTDVESLGSTKETELMTGTSQATAMVSGFLSLIMSQSKNKMTVSKIKEFVHSQKNGDYNFYQNPEFKGNSPQKLLASK